MEFMAVMKRHEDVDGAYVEIPLGVMQTFGGKRVKVKAQFDGEPYRGSIVTMGTCTLIGITKQIRSKIGKGPGDTVRVRVEKDEEERTVILPEDFEKMLDADAEAKAFYDSLSYTNKKSYIAWIESAKRSETRGSRIEKAARMLRNKEKRI